MLSNKKEVEVSQSPVDKMWRRWEKMSYVDLGWVEVEFALLNEWANPTNWVCTGVFYTEKEALKGEYVKS